MRGELMRQSAAPEIVDVATILVAADDGALVASLRSVLEDRGLDVLIARDGMAAIDLARHFAVDLAILDTLFIDLDGFKVCQALRAQCDAPIIMFTVPPEAGAITCLELEADATSPRPFGVRELPDRVGAILKRRNRFVIAPPIDTRAIIPRLAPISVGGLTVLLQERRVYRGDTLIPLTDYEFRVLAFLVQHRGQDCLYPAMIAGIWASGDHVTPHLITYFITQLRKKLEGEHGQPPLIRTVQHAGERGYRIDA
jgi:DNA-binding response OmpR family regulator